jgi:hypothetical protein
MTMKNLGALIVAVAFCGAAGVALADGDGGDNSMNPYTGESWAALQGGGHNLGEYQPKVTVRISKRAEKATPETAKASPEAAKAADTERLHIGTIRGLRTNPFRDDTAA